MLFKIIGSISVLAACSAIGISKSCELVRRVRVLAGIEESLLILESEISGVLTPLPEAMRIAARADISGIFMDAAEGMKSKGADESFSEAVKKSSVGAEEEGALLGFAAGLLSADKEGQLKNINLCRQRIKSIMKRAEETRERLQRVYIGSGALCGIAAVIMLI